MRGKRVSLVGQRFGRYIVLREVDPKHHNRRYLCRCDCGNTREVSHSYLTNAESRSCGCLAGELASLRSTIHGHMTSKGPSPEYIVWQRMKARCLKTNCSDYPRYGGRGIKICERWLSFENFLADMGLKPSPQHTLDRSDNNGDYCPENCAWRTRTEQANNRRSNRRITFQGKTLTLAEWERELGLPKEILKQRLNKLGWSEEKALTTPAINSIPKQQ